MTMPTHHSSETPTSCHAVLQNTCASAFCKELDKLKVPQDVKWRSILLYMRGLEENELLTSEQKSALQTAGLEALQARDFSSQAYLRLVRRKDEILAGPWQEQLRTALTETAKMLATFGTMADSQVDEIKSLESEALTILHEEPDIASAVSRIQSSFQSTIARMEEDKQRLLEMSRTDSLTSLNNRRAIDEFLIQQAGLCAKADKPFAVILADIDHFKAFNDTYGHQVGDQALRSVSKILSELRDELVGSVRSGVAEPLAGRYGGEEFMLALPGFDLEQATDLAEMWRRRVADYSFVLRDESGAICKTDISLTISLGVAEAKELDLERNPEDLVRHADMALYAAKASGRNCLRTAEVM